MKVERVANTWEMSESIANEVRTYVVDVYVYDLLHSKYTVIHPMLSISRKNMALNMSIFSRIYSRKNKC